MSEAAVAWGQESSDAELITAARGGDSAAFGALYERHAGAARTVARQFTRSSADAEDVVSDAFARVYAIVREGGGPDVAFRAYLFTVVRRLAHSRVEAGRRVQPTDDMATFESAFGPVSGVDDPALAGFERGVVANAYGSLPERWQAVLWYTEIERLQPAQVAPLLGLTANGVAALAYRAREGLREAYLQQHLVAAPTDACRAVNGKLGAYVRGGLAKRESGHVRAHLESCQECRGLVLELGDVNHGLRGIIAPLVLGVAGLGALATPLPVGVLASVSVGGGAAGSGAAVTGGATVGSGATAGAGSGAAAGGAAGGAVTSGATAGGAVTSGATAGGAVTSGATAGGAVTSGATAGVSAGTTAAGAAGTVGATGTVGTAGASSSLAASGVGAATAATGAGSGVTGGVAGGIAGGAAAGTTAAGTTVAGTTAAGTVGAVGAGSLAGAATSSAGAVTVASTASAAAVGATAATSGVTVAGVTGAAATAATGAAAAAGAVTAAGATALAGAGAATGAVGTATAVGGIGGLIAAIPGGVAGAVTAGVVGVSLAVGGALAEDPALTRPQTTSTAPQTTSPGGPGSAGTAGSSGGATTPPETGSGLGPLLGAPVFAAPADTPPSDPGPSTAGGPDAAPDNPPASEPPPVAPDAPAPDAGGPLDPAPLTPASFGASPAGGAIVLAPGSPTTVSISIVNSGESDATDLRAALVLPAGVRATGGVSGDATDRWQPCADDAPGGPVEFCLASLPGGASSLLSTSVQVDPGVVLSVPDAIGVNVSAAGVAVRELSVPVSVPATPLDIVLGEVGPASLTAGVPAVVTFVLGNEGRTPGRDVVATVALPAGVGWVATPTAPWTCAADGAGVTCRLADLPARPAAAPAARADLTLTLVADPAVAGVPGLAAVLTVADAGGPGVSRSSTMPLVVVAAPPVDPPPVAPPVDPPVVPPVVPPVDPPVVEPPVQNPVQPPAEGAGVVPPALPALPPAPAPDPPVTAPGRSDGAAGRSGEDAGRPEGVPGDAGDSAGIADVPGGDRGPG